MKLRRNHKKGKNIRRFLSMALAICIVVSGSSTYVAAEGRDMSAQGHQHEDSCYEKQPVTEPEAHGDDCWQDALVCELEGIEGHIHEDSCYEAVQVAGCGEEAHGENCYRKVLICDEKAEEGRSEAQADFGTDAEAADNDTDNSAATNGVEITVPLEPVEITEPTESTESVEPTESTEPTEPINPAESTELTEPTEVTKPADTADSSHAVESTESTKSQEPAEPTTSTEPEESQVPEDNEESQKPEVPGGFGDPIENPADTLELDTMPIVMEIEEAVASVIARIEALEDLETVKDQLDTLKQAGNQQEYDSYYQAHWNQVKEAKEAYDALTKEQQSQVTNYDKLSEQYDWLYLLEEGYTGALKSDAARIEILGMGTKADSAENPDGITDGSAPWDTNQVSDAQEFDGLDKDENNLRVRTFDIVKYDFYYQTTQQDQSDTNHYTAARVYFEFLLPVSGSEAYFDIEKTPWLQNTQQVSYTYDKNTMETIAGTQYQVLRGSFVDDRGNEEITAATASRDVVVRVLNMKNGSTVQPIFTMWMDYNDVGASYDERHIPTSAVYGTDHTCATHKQIEYKTIIPDPVTVTCIPRYNITLKRGEGATTTYVSDFDFATGNEKALDNTMGNRNGRMNSYGIRVMVQGLDAEHGLRGCEFPDPGDTLEFDIQLATYYQRSQDTQRTNATWQFKPLVWSADQFAAGWHDTNGNWQEGQGDGRQLKGQNVPPYAAPFNKAMKYGESCYNGGTWEFTDTQQYSEDGKRIIHVKVSGYEFNPEYLPYANMWQSDRTDYYDYYNPEKVGTEYWNIQNAVFSTGEMWVVTPFYDAEGKEEEHYITRVVEADNLTLWQGAYARELHVKNAGGSETFYKKDLDSKEDSLSLQNPGWFESTIAMLKPLKAYNQALIDGCLGEAAGDSPLKDYATPGTYVDLQMWMSHDEAEGGRAGVAYNNMIKFDNSCFEVVSEAEVRRGTGNNDAYSFFTPYYDGAYGDQENSYTSHTWTTWPEYNAVPGFDEREDKDKYAKHCKMLYGTTADGKGWNHDNPEGYDSEMMKAGPEDLVWYDSFRELEEAGAECVAVLMEYRNLSNDGTMNSGNNSTMNHLHLVIHGKIKDDVETGKVYAITNYSAAWTKDDIAEQAAMYINERSNNNESPSELTVWDYLDYTWNAFPSYSQSRSDAQGTPNMRTLANDGTKFPLPTHERSWKRSTKEREGGLNGANGHGNSYKEQINPDGTITAGSGGWYYIDCVYVIDYKTQIAIDVAQKVTNEAGNLETKYMYNVDGSERKVDFKVSPRAVRSAVDADDSETRVMTEDIEVEVTLPPGLEYKEGTAFWKGEYTQSSASDEFDPNADAGERLELATPDGKPIKDSKGNTVLRWVLKDVELSGAAVELPPIYFSCKIGDSENLSNDVKNNDILTVQADIYSDMDRGREHGPKHGNQYTTSIGIQKYSSLTISKTAEQTVTDLGEPIKFIMKAYNGANGSDAGTIADILPANGVGQSRYNGSLQVKEFKITSAKEGTLDNVTFYYTKKEEYKNTQNAEELLKANPGDWIEFSLVDNIWRPSEEERTGITAIAFEYELPGKSSIEMEITLELPEGKPGDILHNRMMLDKLSSGDRSQIVTRNLEGVTWLDNDQNSLRNEGNEFLLDGVKVTLLQLDMEKLADRENPTDAEKEDEALYVPVYYPGTTDPVTVMTGRQVNVRTGVDSIYKTGQYRFTELRAGIYGIKFESGVVSILDLRACEVDKGSNDRITDRIDSDGNPTYDGTGSEKTLQKTVILNIPMKTAKEMTVTLEESKYHDSGFYKAPQIELEKVGEDKQTPLTDTEAEFTMADSDGNVIGFLQENGSYIIPEGTDSGVDSKLAINQDGKLSIRNLLPDKEYTITETKAPTGYALLSAPVKIRVENHMAVESGKVVNNATITVTDNETMASGVGNVLKICNLKLYELPSTGGPGTGACTAAGVLLMMAPVIYHFCNRKKKA